MLAEIDTAESNRRAPPSRSRGGAPSAASPSRRRRTALPRRPHARPASGACRTKPARRIAERLDLDLARVRGIGPDGLILREDVVAAGRARASAPAPAPAGIAAAAADRRRHATMTPLKGPAAALAGYMEQSLSIPDRDELSHACRSTLDARRKELNGALKAAGRSEKISFTHLIALCARASRARTCPAMTRLVPRDENGEPQRVEAGIHLGLAVDTRAQGRLARSWSFR